jgi:hypothetical protein
VVIPHIENIPRYTLGESREHELNIYNHINSVVIDHPGRKFIRKLLGHLCGWPSRLFEEIQPSYCDVFLDVK